MKKLRLLFLGLLAAGTAFAQINTDTFGIIERLGSDVRSNADSTSFDLEKGTFTWTGNVVIQVRGTEIYADRAEFDAQTERINVSGNLSIYRGDALYRGESAIYNLRTSELDASQLRSGYEPLFFETERFTSTLDEISVINTEKTVFTTDDNPDPSWFIKAKEVRLYPEDRIVFVNPTAYVGKVPVMWLPYLAQPLQEDLGYMFTPGYKSQWGPYLLNRYGTLWGDHSIIQYLLDLRLDRGVAGGINLLSRRWKDSPTFGKFQAYYAYDTDPQKTAIGTGREDRTGLDNGRYRINFHHRVYLPGPEESTLYVDFDVNKISDEFFYEDFFPTDFRLDPNPDNFITLTKQHERFEANLLTRFRVNDFYTSDSRLPELAVDFIRQPILNTGLFYWGNTSVGIYEEKLGSTSRRLLEARRDELELSLSGDLATQLAEAGAVGTVDTTTTSTLLRDAKAEEDQTLLDEIKRQLDGRGFTRLYSYHEVFYPLKLGEVNFIPKVGIGGANYSSVDGPAPDSSTRGIFHAGFDLNTKFSKYYPDITSRAVGLDGLMHVVQPYMKYSYVNATDLGTDFNRIDRLAPTTRPRPLDVPQFTAIDDINTWNVLRLGVENRLLTRRGAGTQPWLVSNTYFDTFLDDPEFDRDFSNLYEDLAWMPLPWLRLNVGAQLPLFGGDLDFTEVNSGITFMPTSNFEFTVGHRLLQSHPFFEDSNLVDLRTYTRLSENWGFSTYHRYEFEDSTFETQQYSLHRDLTSWTAAFGFLLRDHRGETETGLVLSLTLKDFPSLSIPLDIDASGGGN